MGGSSSKSEVKQLSKALTEIAMQTVQSCEVSSQQKQILEVKNTGLKLWGAYKLDQQTEIRGECFSDTKKQADLQSKLIKTVAQSSTAQGVAFLSAFGASDSEAKTKLTSIIKNNVTMKNIQKSYNKIKQEQKAKFTNSGVIGFEQAELTQGSKIFAAATLQEMDKVGIFNQIETHLDQKSVAKTDNPMDFIANMINSMTSHLLYIAFFFVIVIAAVMLLKSAGGSGGTYVDTSRG